jgi:hypothetical protein
LGKETPNRAAREEEIKPAALAAGSWQSSVFSFQPVPPNRWNAEKLKQRNTGVCHS